MPAIVLVTNDYMTVEYRPEEKMIYHTVHKPMGIEQLQLLKDGLNAGTDALKQYGITKWLSDDRLNGPLPPELVKWGSTEWNARTVAAGWKYWANVVPKEVAAAGTLLPVINNLHKMGLTMQVFTNLEEGLKWLAEK
jgi:hypothetical protein